MMPKYETGLTSIYVLQRRGSTVVGMSTTIRTITGLAIIISRTKQQILYQ